MNDMNQVLHDMIYVVYDMNSVISAPWQAVNAMIHVIVRRLVGGKWHIPCH
jgi:hypothetical protein